MLFSKFFLGSLQLRSTKISILSPCWPFVNFYVNKLGNYKQYRQPSSKWKFKGVIHYGVCHPKIYKSDNFRKKIYVPFFSQLLVLIYQIWGKFEEIFSNSDGKLQIRLLQPIGTYLQILRTSSFFFFFIFLSAWFIWWIW